MRKLHFGGVGNGGSLESTASASLPTRYVNLPVSDCGIVASVPDCLACDELHMDIYAFWPLHCK